MDMFNSENLLGLSKQNDLYEAKDSSLKMICFLYYDQF